MRDDREENGELLPDGVGLTKFGKFLRSTSLDELPESFNIFIRDMSVIGSRPLLVHCSEHWNRETRNHHFRLHNRQKYRHRSWGGAVGVKDITEVGTYVGVWARKID